MHAKTRTAIVTAVATTVAILPLGATASAQEAAGTPAPAAITPEARAASAGLPGKIIVVRHGDTLSKLAAEHGVADGWRRLFDSNPQVANPNVIIPGMFLRIPEPQEVFAVRLPAAPAITTTPAPAAPAVAASSTSTGVWDRLANCESGGNWSINTGNGYYGGLQFSQGSWNAVGGTGLPHQASRETQIAMGERLLAVQGWGAWPACARQLGLR